MKKPNFCWSQTLLLFFCVSFVPYASADFCVREAATTLESYGNGQTGRFRRALAGDNDICPEEFAYLEAYLPVREVGHYYGRFSVNVSTYSLSHFRNKSAIFPYTGAAITRTRGVKTNPGLELAIGYVWSKTTRGELEFLVNKNITFSAFPALAAPAVPTNLSTEIKNSTILFNFYYDFEGYDRFRPFVTGGLGVSVSSVQSTITPPPFGTTATSGTLRTGRFAWQLGLGFRVSVFRRWFVNVSYRYINLGPVQLRPPNTSRFRIDGTYSQSALSLGVIYLF